MVARGRQNLSGDLMDCISFVCLLDPTGKWDVGTLEV